MARKRAYKKRADYRKGGRVQYYNGGMTDEDRQEALGAINDSNINTRTTSTPPPVTGPQPFTQADVDKAVADLNSGAKTADQIGAQYGFTGAQISAALADINAASGYTAPAAQTAPVAATAAPAAAPAAATPADAINAARTAAAAPAAPPPPPPTAADISAIPADGDYSTFEIQQVLDALKGNSITAKQVADQFGYTEAQINAELTRQQQIADTGSTSIPDPFGGQAPPDMRSQQRQADLAAADTAQMAAIDVATKADGTTAPGAFVKDYQRVDPNLVFDTRTAATLDPSVGVTPDTKIEKIPDYVDIVPPTGVDKNTFSTAVAEVTKAAKAGSVTPANFNASLVNLLNTPQYAQNRNRPPISVNEINQLTERAATAQFSADQLKTGLGRRTTDVGLSDASFVEKVEPRGQTTLSPTKEAEKQTREAITGTAATSDAAKITDTIDYDSYKRREVTGVAAKDAAVQFTAQTANIPANLARTMVEDPAKVEAQIDNESPEVIAAVAALPQEALVSSQMETLLAGMESGAIPAWAKPAYDAVNQNMTQRGIDSSTVGRDALFNAIIQSAIPIAQSNAQALQTRAAQNLSNEQQANLQRSQLDATRRMNNLANRQTAESQSAQFAQNLNVLQSQFSQERDTLSANQQQQVRLQNLQNQQRTAELNAQNEAASKSQNLGNEQQIELANLEIKNQTEQQNMTAENQERLAEMQVSADFLSKNAGFAQQMELANLSSEQQTRLANLTAQNQAGSQNLTAAQQTELGNLNARMNTNLAQARIAERMGVALLSADQQRAVQNASTVARMDLTKFNDAQQIELANSKFMQTATLTDFNARQQSIMQNATALAGLDAATADQRTKLAITQAQNFLSRDMANLSNEQQALILDTQVEQQRLLSNQASENAAKQFNATSDNQIAQFNESLATQVEQFNATQSNAMAQFNTAEENRVAAMNAGNAIDAAKFNNQIKVQVDSFNEQYDLQREQWNAANAQAIEQSNITWRRNANTIDTAATNATNQENAAKAFQISAADQNFIWQELRDEAAYLRQAYENEEQRTTTLYATAISNDVGGKGADGISPILDLIKNKVVV